MSLDATRWAWMQKLPPTRKLVLLSLADRADENHRCYPSIARLSADTGLYRETIMEAIASMEASGVLSVTRRSGQGSIYQLIGVEDRYAETSREKPTGMEKPTSREKPTRQSGKADYHQSGKADSNLPIEPTKESKYAPSAHLRSLGAEKNLIDEWFKVRKQKRLTNTQTAMNLFVSEVEKSGRDINEVLTKCVEKSWGGFDASWSWSQQQPRNQEQVRQRRAL